MIRSIAATGVLLSVASGSTISNLCVADSAQSQQSRRPITARDLATLTDIDGLVVSPDGAWAAFQTRRADPDTNRYTQAWHVLSTTGGAGRRIADGGDAIQPINRGRVNGYTDVPEPAWSPDNQWIFYLRRDEDRTQVWRARIDGRRNEQLTRNAGNVTALVIAVDGRRIVFETQPSRAQTEAALVAEGRVGHLYDDRFLPAYSVLPIVPANASFAHDASSARNLWVYDIARGRERPATETESAEYDELKRVSRSDLPISPAGARVLTKAQGETRHIAVQRATAKEAIVCLHRDCTAEGLRAAWWRTEDEVIFARHEEPNTTLYAWRVGAAEPRRILTTFDKLVTRSAYWRCAIGGDRLICFYETVNYPRRLAAVNLDSGAVEILHDPNPHFAQFELGSVPQYLRIEVDPVVETFGYLVLPPRRSVGERLPLVIVTYRCSGFLRGGTGDEYPVFPLAAEGFAVLCYDIPTEDRERMRELGSLEAYQSWARGPGNPIKHRIQDGLDAAVAQLESSGLIDAERVGLTGLSYGAETVTFALFNMQKVAAAIASGTEFGPSSTFLYGSTGREGLRPWGLQLWDSPRWDALSITRNAERVRAPLLLNVSDHEMLSALHPYSSLEQAGRAVEMHVFPDEYHIKWQPAHRLAIYNRNIDWMNFWLRGVEDPAPSKADQYRRWRAMRVKQCDLFKGDDAPWYCRQ